MGGGLESCCTVRMVHCRVNSLTPLYMEESGLTEFCNLILIIGRPI